MSARHFEYDKHTGELKRSGHKKKYNPAKDYLETMTTLSNKTHHQTKLKKPNQSLNYLKKQKSLFSHKNTQVKRAKQKQKNEIHKAENQLKIIKSKWNITASTIEQLGKIAKNKQKNKKIPTVTNLTKVPLIVTHSGSAYKGAKKGFKL